MTACVWRWRFSCQPPKARPLAPAKETLTFGGMGDSVGNLDARAQNAQLRFGVVMIAAALALAVVLLGVGAPAPYRALLAIPLFLGTYGVYAGLTRVCGFTALRGMRMTESGPAPVADRSDLESHRRRGLRVLGGSATIALAATVLLLLAH